MEEHVPFDAAPDPLACVDDWLDDDRMKQAQAVLDGVTLTEQQRTLLALAIGEELGVLQVAATQLRLAFDLWHGTRRPIAEFKNGVVELRREEAEIVKARNVYHRALGLVKMRAERKAARGALIDAAIAWADGGEIADLAAVLSAAVDTFVELEPAGVEQRDRRKVTAA